MKRACLVLLPSLLLAGCATKYGDMGFTGGVKAEPIMTDVYRIQARGNGFTGSAAVQDFVLLKAAETTLAAGGTHFVILNASDQTTHVQMADTATTTTYGGTSFTTVNPGGTVAKPGSDVMIKVLRAPAPNAFSARDIVQTIGPRLKPPAS
jgi:hypothetical protein